jgi:outer membrane protein assembly factor BamB
MNVKLRFLLTAVSSVAFAAIFTGCQTSKGAQPAFKPSLTTPCMDVLGLFTATNVPAMGPAETEAPVGKWTNGITPDNLPGNGLAQHPMLYAGENYNKMFLIKDGKPIWTYSTGGGYEYDDVWMLSNGNILFTRMQYLAEITPDKKVVWRYDCTNPKGTGPDHTEVHTCQPIGLDRVMFVLNGLPPRLMVVNIKTGTVEVNYALPDELFNPKAVHGQFRRARYTAQGTYLLACLGRNEVVELDKNFKEVWSYKINSPWAAIRLKNGNTLITDEKDSLTREVNPQGETVWEFKNTNLPEPYRFVEAPQSCTRLANGNTIFCSRGNKGKTPQIVEVTPDKKVVWVLQDWKDLGSASAVQVLDDPGIPENPGESEH